MENPFTSYGKGLAFPTGPQTGFPQQRLSRRFTHIPKTPARHKDRVEYPRTLLCRLHPRHLRPRNNQYAADRSRKSRTVPTEKYPVRVKNGSRARIPQPPNKITTQKEKPFETIQTALSLVRMAIQNFLKNPVISMVLGLSDSIFSRFSFIKPHSF